MRPIGHAPVLLVLGVACASGQTPAGPPPTPLPPVDLPTPPADFAARTDAPAVLIRGATILTAAGEKHSPGYLLMQDGRIAAVGQGEPENVPDGATVIPAEGQWVTPGLIDPHSHLGVFPLPGGQGTNDGNEAVAPITAEVWAEHGFHVGDAALWRAVAAGITTVQILPGSTNLIGGRSLTAKLLLETSARGMRFVGAPQGVKMACGENPKRVYAEKGGPHTRMGNAARVRAAFFRAREYNRNWQRFGRDLKHWQTTGGVGADGKPTDPPDPPTRDLGLDTLVGILNGDILVHAHCYRADDMHVMLDLAAELGFEIRAFHHALEAYKLADRLSRQGVGVVTWTDWWGFKREAYDGIPHNIALVAKTGGRPMLHSDSPAEIRQLNQEAAKARAAGRQLGFDFSDDQALRWVTAHPAWALGIADQTGSLEVGKMADVVIWDGYPFSVYTRADMVFIDGFPVFDRSLPRPRSDLELGQPVRGEDTP